MGSVTDFIDLLGAMGGGPRLAGFALASLILAATPGPGVLYVVSCTVSRGRRAGLASVAGVALGNLGNAWAASLGLAAVLAASALAFDLLRYAGAAYLVWLGVKAWRASVEPRTALQRPWLGPDLAPDGARQPADVPTCRHFRDGAVVALFNPKTALFFAAFLPQFMVPGASAMAQSLALGAAFVAIAACTDTAYVLAAGAVAPAFTRRPGATRVAQRGSALVFMALGLWTACSGGRARG